MTLIIQSDSNVMKITKKLLNSLQIHDQPILDTLIKNVKIYISGNKIYHIKDT